MKDCTCHDGKNDLEKYYGIDSNSHDQAINEVFEQTSTLAWQCKLLHCETRGEGVKLMVEVLKEQRKQAVQDVIAHLKEEYNKKWKKFEGSDGIIGPTSVITFQAAIQIAEEFLGSL